MRTAATSTRTAVARLVTRRWIDPALAGRVHGLSIFYPSRPTSAGIEQYFIHYAFAKELGWSELVRRVHQL
ncbi:MAG: hypothetical protein H0T89_16140 [Deltaproteobacteria bacterium]|nr:hypothetical protein [Deltaproteobacteria bacterium]MDQ3299752.1 hypothetical protein [Myxococcota bacterium]